MELILSNDHVMLRPLQQKDASAIAELINNKKIWDNVRDMIPHPYRLEDAIGFIEICRKQEQPLTFGIEYNDQLCGVIGLVPQHDVHRKNAEIGYWVGEPFWNKGIAGNAVNLITTYGFGLGFHRIYAGIFEYNIASMKVLEKNGYIKEAVFRQSIYKNNMFWDEHCYAILAK